MPGVRPIFQDAGRNISLRLSHGPQHAAVELHGYLTYIVLCALKGTEYTIFGYKGKQVRDQIHCDDVASLFLEFYQAPRCGEVYNLGGGRENSISILETIESLRQMGFKLRYGLRDESRVGDHICYISELAKVRSHFPNWRIKYDLPKMLSEIVERCGARRHPEIANGRTARPSSSRAQRA